MDMFLWSGKEKNMIVIAILLSVFSINYTKYEVKELCKQEKEQSEFCKARLNEKVLKYASDGE